MESKTGKGPRVGISNAKSSKLIRQEKGAHGLKPLGRLPGGGRVLIVANDESDLGGRLGRV